MGGTGTATLAQAAARTTARLRCSGPGNRWDPCRSRIMFMIDGKPYCARHAEKLWESGMDATEHRVLRI